VRHTGETPSGVTGVVDPLAARGRTSPAGADAGLTGIADRSGRALPPENGLPPTCVLPPAEAGPSGEAGTPAGRAVARRRARVGQLPYLVVLACTVGGCLWAWRGAHDVSRGSEVVGGALLAAAVARLLLPQDAVGLLASRRRFADVLALGAFGVGLLVLALVLPPI
jgi:Protein of unknown function (DUF3017)